MKTLENISYEEYLLENYKNQKEYIHKHFNVEKMPYHTFCKLLNHLEYETSKLNPIERYTYIANYFNNNNLIKNLRKQKKIFEIIQNIYMIVSPEK